LNHKNVNMSFCLLFRYVNLLFSKLTPMHYKLHVLVLNAAPSMEL